MSTMTQSLRRAVATTALVLCAQLSFAQETAAPAADPTLSMGTEVISRPALPTQELAEVGQLYLSAIHGSWELRCVKAEDGSDPCRLYQLILDATGSPTAEISLFSLPEGSQAEAGAAILVPLDTLLSANLTFSVDANRELIYPYTVCSTDGCIARIGFSAEQIAQMKNGAAATLTLTPAGAPDQRVPLNLSLKGFTAGYEAVVAANTP